jgi:hypothetical protein
MTALLKSRDFENQRHFVSAGGTGLRLAALGWLEKMRGRLCDGLSKVKNRIGF